MRTAERPLLVLPQLVLPYWDVGPELDFFFSGKGHMMARIWVNRTSLPMFNT
jgi:hypothetical protein